ncbi:Putative transposase [Caballeronia udeis]|uniref:Putative transposase n=1 Tax=Caballeronia udeis TaxID=1232866 RepID=A0A158GIH6_9BURK|nr:Putative transposase [Caballeronia udeis]
MLDYLGRYTHRVAISNNRLLSFDGHVVQFRWKDYRHEARHRTMTLTADEFIRRFLLHVLPAGFKRIRSYGWLANGFVNLPRVRRHGGRYDYWSESSRRILGEFGEVAPCNEPSCELFAIE